MDYSYSVNTNVNELTPYKPGRPVEEIQREYNLDRIVKLASNENPFSVSPAVAAAIQEEVANINFYPETNCFYLRRKLAEYNGVEDENVVVGCGSVEIIRMIVKTFLKPGETVLTSEKSFVFYKVATVESFGKAAYVEAPMDENYTFDLDAIYDRIDEKTRIIFITNPNNPTGTMLPKQKILDFIDRVPEDKIIVLDNAYHEYVEDQANYAGGIREAVERKNVIVLRTFSKIYALAGLRVGYAITNKDIIALISRMKAPFNVPRLSQVAALASLQDDEFKNKSAALNAKNKKKLFKQLTDMGFRVIPSETNFLMFLPGQDPMELNKRLLQEGVIIRPLAGFGVPEAIRVTVGFEEDNDFFIEKLKKIT